MKSSNESNNTVHKMQNRSTLTKSFKAFAILSLIFLFADMCLFYVGIFSALCFAIAIYSMPTTILFTLLFICLPNCYLQYVTYWLKGNRKTAKHLFCFILLILIIFIYFMIELIGYLNISDEISRSAISVILFCLCLASIILFIIILINIHKPPHMIKSLSENKQIRKEKRNLKERNKQLLKEKNVNTYSNRKWVTTLLLCVCFGWVGAHRLYVGKKKYGITTLVMSLCIIGNIVFLIPNIIDFVKIVNHSYRDYKYRLITDIKKE